MHEGGREGGACACRGRGEREKDAGALVGVATQQNRAEGAQEEAYRRKGRAGP